jgi:hypothetical protein
MKSIFILLFSICFCYAFSQQKNPEGQANSIVLKLNRELELNSDQAKKLNEMMIKSYIEADKIRKDTKITKEIKKERLNIIYDLRKNQMNEILTIEQQQKYQNYIDNSRKK